ncbi:MAG: RNA-binding domain-containing protein [Promethearchaeota archaeon]
MFIDRIEARAHSRATEVIERVQTAVLNLFPESIQESVRVTVETTEGHRQTRIVVISAVLEDKAACDDTLSFIAEAFSESDRRAIIRSLTQRLDDQCILFLRIDKQESFLGEIQLATGPDIISVKMHLKQYPRCKPLDVETFLVERFHLDRGQS